MRKRRIPWGAVAIGAGVLLFVALLTFPAVGRGECRDSSDACGGTGLSTDLVRTAPLG